jgi:hypothetical protein
MGNRADYGKWFDEELAKSKRNSLPDKGTKVEGLDKMTKEFYSGLKEHQKSEDPYYRHQQKNK